jgi:hypothetical protein
MSVVIGHSKGVECYPSVFGTATKVETAAAPTSMGELPSGHVRVSATPPAWVFEQPLLEGGTYAWSWLQLLGSSQFGGLSCPDKRKTTRVFFSTVGNDATCKKRKGCVLFSLGW